MLDPNWRELTAKYVARQQERDSKLKKIFELLPPPGKILKVREFVELIRQLHEIVGISR